MTHERIYDRNSVADLMALVDTYADTSYVNGVRSAWAQMARANVEKALMDLRATPISPAEPAPSTDEPRSCCATPGAHRRAPVVCNSFFAFVRGYCEQVLNKLEFRNRAKR